MKAPAALAAIAIVLAGCGSVQQAVDQVQGAASAATGLVQACQSAQPAWAAGATSESAQTALRSARDQLAASTAGIPGSGDLLAVLDTAIESITVDPAAFQGATSAVQGACSAIGLG